MALYKETHKIKVFEPNSITLNAVQGEGNEREYEFILIEKSGDTLKTTNAPITDKMLDVTGCSVRLYVAKADGHIVYMEGKVADAKGGVISFVPKQQVFTASGKANCILQITSANGDLRAVGVTLNIGKAEIDGALESKDELTALAEAVIKTEKLYASVNQAIGQVTTDTEIILARGDENTLSERLDKFIGKQYAENNFANVKNAGAIKILNENVIVQPQSLKNSVDEIAIKKSAVTSSKIADGAVTDAKIGQGNVKSIADDFSNSGIIGFNLEKLEKTIKTEFNSGLGITSIGYSIPFLYDGRNFKYLYLPSVKMVEDGQLTFMLCKPSDLLGKQVHETERLANRKTKVALSAGLHTNVCVELNLDYSQCEAGTEYLICIYGIQETTSPTYSSATKFQLSNIANTANVAGVLTGIYKDALYLPPSGAWRWTKANAGAEYYITVQCALGVEYPYQSDITSFVNAQIEAGKKPERMANYLPPEIPAVVGDPLELFWDSIFGAKNITDYRLKVQWDNNAWLGEVYDRKLKWTPLDSHIGPHTLKVTVYDDFDREISAASTTVRVYPVRNPAVSKNLLIIGDSLTQYGDDKSTVNTLCTKLQENGVTNLNLIGTQKMASNPNACHEGRAGWKVSDYLDVSKSPFAVNGTIDFKAYCEKHGYSGIDYCIIHLNWNDTFTDYSGVASRLRALAEKVQESYPECRIMFVSLSSYPKTRMNLWGFCLKTSAWELSKALQAVTGTKENWSTIHLLQERDCEYNNGFVEQPVNLRNDMAMKVLTDHVHGGTGEYQQIGDTYYRAIMAQINKDKQ